jgi:formyl-CoA transferase
LGADVIKVEDPEGDPFRRWQSDERPFSPQFAAHNRNKKSVVLDLRSESGLRDFLLLADLADVLIENFRPGVTDRLGIGAESLTQRNPRLVYCAITGFGQTGPYADRPSFDTIVSAIGGLYAQLLDATHPVLAGPPFADLTGGLFAVQGILAALLARSTTGRGQVVHVSLLAALASGLLAEPASTYLDVGESTGPTTRQKRAQAYVVAGSDNRAFVIHLSVPEKFWNALTRVIGEPQLVSDVRFASRRLRYEHYDELDNILKAAFARRPRQYWLDRLRDADVPHGPVNDLGDVFADPALETLDLVHEMPMPGSRPLRSARYPVDFSLTPASVRRTPPGLGADTDAVLMAAKDGKWPTT